MHNELTDIELLTKTIEAYKMYIDCHCDLSEEARSDLLMKARALDIECESRGLYAQPIP